MTGPARPLRDVTVLELGHIVAGPFCTLVLADLGATVIKVEHPDGGDAIRNSSAIGASSFNYLNRDKQSFTVDLDRDEGLAVFYDLAAEADVVVENFGPGTADRLGVGYDALASRVPGIVYCSIKGFGAGPYEDYPALDPVAEAMSGLMRTTGHPGMPPVRSGTSLADMAAAMYGAVGVTGALRERSRTGDGQFLEVPLFESTVAWMGYWLAYAQAYGETPEPLGAGHPNWSPYDVFETADDRWLFVGPSSHRQWVALNAVLESDLHEQPAYETLEDRRRNEDALLDDLGAILGDVDAEPVATALREAGVPAAVVRTVDEVADDPHLTETGAMTDIRTVEGTEATVSVPRFPVRSSAFDRVDSTDPPGLGEDTDAILRSLGYDPDRIESFRAGDVI